MQIYGSSLNQALFKRYGLTILDRARMNVERALPGLQVFLGTIFTSEPQVDKEQAVQSFGSDHLYFGQMEWVFEEYGEKGIAAHFDRYLCREIGLMVQRAYMPPASVKWKETESLLNANLDYERQYNLACLTVAELFSQALKLQEEFSFTRQAQADQETETVNRKIDPHLWRMWFYQLWGQHYDWGRFRMRDKVGEVNGEDYFFDLPPRLIHQRSFISAKPFLEAHGYQVIFHNNGAVEYWR